MSGRQIVTKAIVLNRTNFGEADRIISVLTPEYGKLSLIAKGVRKIKSKLAGGIELFSISDITYIVGRGEVGTLVSSRLDKHFGHIAGDIKRTMHGYESLKRIGKVTEDGAEREYYELIVGVLAGLDDNDISLDLVELWELMNILSVSGRAPNLKTGAGGESLEEQGSYIFDYDKMAFSQKDGGPYSSGHIKLMRLAARSTSPRVLCKISGLEEVLPESLALARNIIKLQIH